MKFIRSRKILSALGTLALVAVITACSSAGGSKSASQATTTTRATVSALASSSSPSHSSVSQAAGLAGVYKTVCDLLGAGGTTADVVSVINQGLEKGHITGYSGKQIVKTAEKKDCAMYLNAALTVAQQQAVQAAQSYLSMGSGFSYNSLLGQLTSSSGNGFAKSDATAAIKSLHLTEADWDAQAVDAAKGYMQLGGFSRASLIQQLTSSYGNGFTEAEAEYAANKVGL